MTFQSTVNLDQPLGVPGEMIFDGPTRAAPYLLNSASAAYNIVGATAYTVSSEGVAAAGGTGVFAGILAKPKTYASYGTSAGGPLAATMTLPNNATGEMLQMGIMVVALPNSQAANIGDLLTYNTTTGVISTVAPVASFTASQTTNVLTVTAITAGNLGIGSVVNTGSAIVRIISLGTGTGGTGTYNVDTSASVSSATMTANSVAPSGTAFVPNAVITRYTQSGASTGNLAVAKLTN